MTDMVTSPLPYHTKIQTLERTITLKYGQTTAEQAVKL